MMYNACDDVDVDDDDDVLYHVVMYEIRARSGRTGTWLGYL